MIKLLAIDLDDTLLNSKKEISEENARSIRMAKEKGVNIVIATGRPFVSNTIKFYQQLGLYQNGLYIAYNGAALYEVSSEKVISNNCLKKEELIEIEDFFKQYAESRYLHVDKKIICSKINQYSELERTYNNIDIEVATNIILNAEEQNVYKYMVADEPDIIKEIYDKIPLSLKEKYNIFISMPCFIEVVNKDVNKYQAISSVARMLGVNDNEIMAIGDSMNDYEMIKNASIGVAMEGAVPRVKDVANFITKSNDQDGVGVAIKKFIL